MKWTEASMPSQAGEVVIVTGGNSGIGFEAARALAKHGAEVVLACRSEARGEEAASKIRAESPGASVRAMVLDLADLESVAAFAERFKKEHTKLDRLINNAGVMMCPASKTAQGFETQLGVNHLGHFALTGHLLELLRATPGARVVTVSSQLHRPGVMVFDDLHFEKRAYDKSAAYAQSKLANLLFTFELQRRLERAGIDTLAVAAHPGWTNTDLQRYTPSARLFGPLFAMPAPQGALPTLRAATARDVQGGDYYGPHALYQMRGYPVRVGCSKRAQSETDAATLWQVSEELTGVHYLDDATRAPERAAS